MSTEKKELSVFAQAAMALDADFTTLAVTSAELERLDIQSDAGLKRGKILLARFAECGQRVGANIQALSGALNQAQADASGAAKIVSDKAAAIQERQQHEDSLLHRFNFLNETLRKFNEAVTKLRDLSKGEGGTGGEGAFIAEHVPGLSAKLGELVEEVGKIEADAKAANMKTLQKDANSLGQSMQSMRRKLESLAARNAG